MDMAAKFQEQRVFHIDRQAAGDGARRRSTSARCGPRSSRRTATSRGCATTFRWCWRSRRTHDAHGALAVGDRRRAAARDRAARHRGRTPAQARAAARARDLRAMLPRAVRGTLSELWARGRAAARARDRSRDRGSAAARRLALAGRRRGRRLRRALPARLLRHVSGRPRSGERRRKFRALVDGLVRKLSDILRAAFVHSQAGQRAGALRAASAARTRDVFDFAVMSRLVRRACAEGRAARRRGAGASNGRSRCCASQPFFADPERAEQRRATFDFGFDNCAAAAAAYRERLPRAGRSREGDRHRRARSPPARYVEADHDAFFERYRRARAHGGRPGAVSRLPRLHSAGRNDAPENAGLMEMLSAGLPVKVLVEPTDLLEEASVGTGHFAFGVRSVRLANTAMGLGGVFVVQATERESLRAARARRAGASASPRPGAVQRLRRVAGAAGELPPYLTAAAAMESRAFPAFTYDADRRRQLGGALLARGQPQSRSRLAGRAVRVRGRGTAARGARSVAFTFADFVLCDRRYAAHFAAVPRERWNAAMLPVAEWLRAAREVGGRPRSLRAGGRRRRRCCACDRRCAADAGRAPLPAAVASAAGAGRHPQFACRAAARARTRQRGRPRRQQALSGRWQPAAAGREPSDADDAVRPPAADGRRSARSAAVRRGVDRDRALPELQRVPEHQRQDVHVQREQAGLHRGPQRRHLPADGRGGRGLPGRDHPPGQAVESGEAGLDELMERAKTFM